MLPSLKCSVPLAPVPVNELALTVTALLMSMKVVGTVAELPTVSWLMLPLKVVSLVNRNSPADELPVPRKVTVSPLPTLPSSCKSDDATLATS